MLKFQREFCAQFKALYAASMTDALAGRAHDQRATAHKRLAADVAKVVQAVAQFRLLQRLRELERAAANAEFRVDGNTLNTLVAEIYKPATAFDDGVIAFIGNARFNTSRRGHKSTPVRSFVKSLARVYRVFALSEAYTSKRCSCCGSTLERASATSYRFWFCPHCGVDAAFNKDFGACRSLLRNGLLLITTGKKPARWCTLEQVYNDKRAKRWATRRAVPGAAPQQTQERQPTLAEINAADALELLFAPRTRARLQREEGEVIDQNPQDVQPPPDPPPDPQPALAQCVDTNVDDDDAGDHELPSGGRASVDAAQSGLEDAPAFNQ